MIRQLKSNSDSTITKSAIFTALLAMMLWGYSSPVAAKEQVVLIGKIKGATCVHFGRICPADEAHLALESDFVLLLEDGSHYFLSNLSQLTKVRYATKTVQVTGEKEGHEIWVDKFAVKDGDKYKTVWTWKEQQEQYRLGGG